MTPFIETALRITGLGALTIVILMVLTIAMTTYYNVMIRSIERNRWLGDIMAACVLLVIIVIACMVIGCIVDFAIFMR